VLGRLTERAEAQRGITTALLVLIPLSIVAVSCWRITYLDPTDRFFDDFFYYAQVARNWTHGQGSTFFPGEPTNGYHPLWFLWISALIWIFGDGPTFFAAVDLSIAGLLIGFFVLYQVFLRRVTGPLAAVVGAGVAVVAIAPRAMWGLEMALTVVAVAAVLSFLADRGVDRPRNALIAGLLVAIMVLSRLDSAALIPGIVVACFGSSSWRSRGLFVVGMSPVAAYAALNMSLYGQLSTTSMAAKSLASYLPPNWNSIATETPFGGAREIVVGIVIVTVLVLLPRSLGTRTRRLCIALATAPVLEFAAQVVLSGWGTYPWYWYFDFMTMGLAAALVVDRAVGRGRMVSALAVVLVVAAYPLSFQGGLAPNRDIAALARQLDGFAADHPGVYAMGDAAGTPGWLIGRPIVHLEGLMMSHGFLDRIRRQQPLPEVFRDYHVDYYVAVRSEGTDTDGCAVFAEPNPSQSSPRAPHLTATVCAAPLAVLTVGKHYRARIYAVDPATGAIG